MNAESLQSLCTAVMLLGFLLIGMGGLGTIFLSSNLRKQEEIKTAAAQAELNARASTLQTVNEELRKRLDPFDAATRNLILEKLGASTTAPSAEAESLFPETPISLGPDITHGLSQSQRRQIIHILSKHPGRSIALKAVLGDSKGFEFAQALRDAFLEAGWHVDAVHHAASASPPFGLWLASGTAPPPTEMIATYLALTSAGFDISQQLDPRLGPDITTLTVGRNSLK